MKSLNTDNSWTIFLDRDGVINEKIDNDYVRSWKEFSFTKNATDAISGLSKNFGRILVVTNQRGVGKGLMTEDELITIHENMRKKVDEESGRIDKIYY